MAKPIKTILNNVWDFINSAINVNVVASSAGAGASDVTIGDTVNPTATQNAAKAVEFDGSPFPNPVAEGQAQHQLVTLHGVAPVGIYNADGSVTPLDDVAEALRILNLSPLNKQYTPPVPLVANADIGTVNDTWIDQGGEINCRGFTHIGFWVKLAHNNSAGNQIQFLSKHSAGGVDEYERINLADYQFSLGNVSRNLFIAFQVQNTISFLQVQTKATTLGVIEDTITIDVTKGWAG